MVEYAILIMLVLLVAVVAVKAFGGKVSAQFSEINVSLEMVM